MSVVQRIYCGWYWVYQVGVVVVNEIPKCCMLVYKSSRTWLIAATMVFCHIEALKIKLCRGKWSSFSESHDRSYISKLQLTQSNIC